MFERLVERLQQPAQTLGDRPPHDLPDDGKKRVDEHLRLLLDRLANAAIHRRLEGAREFAAAFAAHLHGLRQHAGDVFRATPAVLGAVAQFAELLLLAADQEMAEFLEFVHRIGGRAQDAPGTRNSFFNRRATSVSISASASRPVMALRICCASLAKPAWVSSCRCFISSLSALD